MVCVIGKYTVQLPKDQCSHETLEMGEVFIFHFRKTLVNSEHISRNCTELHSRKIFINLFLTNPVSAHFLLEQSKHNQVNTKSKQQPQTTQLWYEAKDTHGRTAKQKARSLPITMSIWSTGTLFQEQVNSLERLNFQL